MRGSRSKNILPVSYATSSFSCWMSVPKTLHALPARERSAVKVDPSLLTFVALYPGQASRVAGLTQTAAATPRSPRRVRGFDKTAMEERGRSRGRGLELTSIFHGAFILSHQECIGCFKLSASIHHHRFEAKNSLTVSILENTKRCNPTGDPPPMTPRPANRPDYQNTPEEAACKTRRDAHQLYSLPAPTIIPLLT